MEKTECINCGGQVKSADGFDGENEDGDCLSHMTLEWVKISPTLSDNDRREILASLLR